MAVPKSEVSLTIPPDSLRKLPQGSAYHAKSGQANLTVKNDGDGNIVAEASCDSLQRLVEWYEEELTRIRNDTSEEEKNDVRTTEKQPPNSILILLVAFIAGVASGIIITLKIKKRNGKE